MESNNCILAAAIAENSPKDNMINEVFLEKYGMSINTFCNQKRIERALHLLKATKDNITEIASACGFNNVGYFTEVFSKTGGITPTQFRTSCADVCFRDVSVNWMRFPIRLPF